MAMKRPCPAVLVRLGLPALVAAVGCAAVRADNPPAPPAPAPGGAVAPQPPADPIEVFQQQNPGLRILPGKAGVDMEVEVALREAPLLECLVCTRGTKDHESLFVTDLKPSQLHLALLLIGLNPGQPRSVVWVGPNKDEPKLVPASGPEVQIVAVTRIGDQEVEVPITDWLVTGPKREKAPASTWMFTGSMFKQFEGRQFYVADANGPLVSLCHFGFDTLAPHTAKTDQADSAGEDFGCRAAAIPPVNTKLTLRFKPVPKPEEKKTDGKTGAKAEAKPAESAKEAPAAK